MIPSNTVYISLNKNIYNILNENNGKVIINSVDKETNNQINKYLKIPREIFLLYFYYINIISKANILILVILIK